MSEQGPFMKGVGTARPLFLDPRAATKRGRGRPRPLALRLHELALMAETLLPSVLAVRSGL
jgi:hypothetical protein